LDTQWIQAEGVSNNLDGQWRLTKTTKKIERSTPLAFSKAEMFSLKPDEWSTIHVGERGTVAFYRMVAHHSPKTAPMESMDQGHQILAMDAKRDLMQHLLKKIGSSGAIRLADEN